MAYYEDLKISKQSWVDVHTALGLSAGDPIRVQNTGTVAIRLVNAVSAPTTENIGKYIKAIEKEQAGDFEATCRPLAGQVTWAIARHNVTDGTLSVESI